MKQIALLIFAICSPGLAQAECIPDVVKRGSSIPRFEVVSTEGLQERWDKYVSEHPSSPVMSSGVIEARPVSEQCLVGLVLVDQAVAHETAIEKFIVQKPCKELELGKVVRVLVGRYCACLEPDFYSTLSFRHATVTRRKRY